ncbi:hypothetical protein Aperf_G00000030902 [Anoplocephala perfoliata]
MAAKSRSQVAEEINSTFGQMEEIYVSIRDQCANLASLRRREKKIGQRYMFYDAERPSANQLGHFVDRSVLESISMSFATAVASAAEKVSESMELFRSTALKIFSFCDSLSILLTESVETQSRDVCAFQQLAEALMRLTGGLADEIDLISYWAYSNISPKLVPTSVSPSFRFASSCLPDRMMTRTIWRDDVYPLLIELNL